MTPERRYLTKSDLNDDMLFLLKYFKINGYLENIVFKIMEYICQLRDHSKI